MQTNSRRGLHETPAYRVRRREPRYVVCMPVSVTRFLPRGPVVTPGLSLDVSRSGMSLLVCGAPHIGETVLISQRSATKPFEILAIVRHSTEGRTGFEFLSVLPVDERGIQDWIDERCETNENWFRAG